MSTRPEYIEQDCGYSTPCWLWQHFLTHKGYGLKRDPSQNRRKRPAHCVYYERYVGPVPEGLQLDHLCRVRHCVNPTHLEPVTQTENLRRGLSTKLTTAAIADIRASRGRETQTETARRYGVTQGYVSNLQLGIGWVDVEAPQGVRAIRGPWPVETRAEVVRLRAETDLTLNQISDQTGVPFSTVCQWIYRTPKRVAA